MDRTRAEDILTTITGNFFLKELDAIKSNPNAFIDADIRDALVAFEGKSLNQIHRELNSSNLASYQKLQEMRKHENDLNFPLQVKEAFLSHYLSLNDCGQLLTNHVLLLLHDNRYPTASNAPKPKIEIQAINNAPVIKPTSVGTQPSAPEFTQKREEKIMDKEKASEILEEAREEAFFEEISLIKNGLPSKHAEIRAALIAFEEKTLETIQAELRQTPIAKIQNWIKEPPKMGTYPEKVKRFYLNTQYSQVDLKAVGWALEQPEIKQALKSLILRQAPPVIPQAPPAKAVIPTPDKTITPTGIIDKDALKKQIASLVEGLKKEHTFTAEADELVKGIGKAVHLGELEATGFAKTALNRAPSGTLGQNFRNL